MMRLLIVVRGIEKHRVTAALQSSLHVSGEGGFSSQRAFHPPGSARMRLRDAWLLCRGRLIPHLVFMSI